MTDMLDGVRDHYRATGLTERLKTALPALGHEDQRFTPQQLAGLDQFHTRGLMATAELAALAQALAGRRAFWQRPMAAKLRASISASRSWRLLAI
jgi:sarcosine/dimethylglycine N-methyltransferase